MLKESLQRSCELDEVGGPAYIASLIDGVPVAINAAYYARVVHEHFIKRALITELGHRIDEAYKWDGPVAELLERVADRDGTDQPTTIGRTPRAVCDGCGHVPRSGSAADAAGAIPRGRLDRFLCREDQIWQDSDDFGNGAVPPAQGRLLRLPTTSSPCAGHVATEQPRASFVNQLQDAGLQGDEDVVVTYLSSWRGRPWSRWRPHWSKQRSITGRNCWCWTR